MTACNDCGMHLFTTDKGECPKCKLPPKEYCSCMPVTPPDKIHLKSPMDYTDQIKLDNFMATHGERNLAAITKMHILRTYRANNGHKTKTAKDLGVSLKTLYNKLEEYGMHIKDGE